MENYLIDQIDEMTLFMAAARDCLQRKDTDDLYDAAVKLQFAYDQGVLAVERGSMNLWLRRLDAVDDLDEDVQADNVRFVLDRMQQMLDEWATAA